MIIFSPFYENYGAGRILSGVAPVFVPLSPPDFTLDPDELRTAFDQGVKAMVLCNPANPTGQVFSPEELKSSPTWRSLDGVVITDEVYEHIVYPPYEHTYFASLPGMYERTISSSSLSKTYSITGWRLGYVIAPPAISGRSQSA